MTIHPLLKHIKEEMQRLFPDRWCLIKFYVDDGNFMAPFYMMVEIFKILKTCYKNYGYKLKTTKGHYLLGRCKTDEDAEDRRLQLIELGLHPSR